MRHMDLNPDNKKSCGKEIPGMIFLYLVEMTDGQFYVREGDFFPHTTDDWAQARFFFAYNGVLEAKEIARRYGGKVCIVNCTPVQEYKG